MKPISQFLNYDYLHTMYKIPQSLVKKIHNDIELITVICKNFYSNYAKNFITFSHLSLSTLSGLLPISLSTLQRELKNRNKNWMFP